MLSCDVLHLCLQMPLPQKRFGVKQVVSALKFYGTVLVLVPGTKSQHPQSMDEGSGSSSRQCFPH